MLNRMNLDDKTYQEIAEDAIYHIPKEYPEWTNYNLSDPGITLVQLFSWLKEIQQYHLSQISDWKRQKYLRLLGMEIRHMCPARGALNIEPGPEWNNKVCSLPKGTRFYAGDIPFETVEKAWIYPTKVISTYTISGKRISNYKNIGYDIDKKMKLYPFGEFPQSGDQCYFVLDRALDSKRKTEIYFEICTQYEVSRNPIDEEFIPLAKLKWEYQTENGWAELIVVRDDTYGLLQNGNIQFRMEHDMVQDKTFHAYQIRATLLENEYDVAPLVENIFLNEVHIHQQYTGCDYEDYEVILENGEKEIVLKSELYLAQEGYIDVFGWTEKGWSLITEYHQVKELDGYVKILIPIQEKVFSKYRVCVCENALFLNRVIGKGTAFANQEYRLNFMNVIYDEFEIMAYDKYTDCFIHYQKVEDFDNSAAEDAVYILDVKHGKIIFGNCENGMAPDGEIRIIRLKSSLGRDGNIKANTIKECETYPELVVKQYKMTSGGRDNESIDQCFERFRREMKKVSRGVTYSDYEELVKNAPGLLIVDSRVIPPSEWQKKGDKVPENQITIVVQPLEENNKRGYLSKKYRQNLERILLEKKMLGTRIKVMKPEYIGISVFAEIDIKAQFHDAEMMIEDTVRKYLNDKIWKIGTPVLGSTIYGIIDTLPCVWQVRSLSLDAVGIGCRRLVNGDINLPPNGIAYLKEINMTIYTAD